MQAMRHGGIPGRAAAGRDRDAGSLRCVRRIVSYRPRHRLQEQGGKLHAWRKMTPLVSCVLAAALLAAVLAVTRLSPHPVTGAFRSHAAQLAEHPDVDRQATVSHPVAGAGHKPRRVSIGKEIAAFARRYATGLNHPYLTGGTSSASGWDCTYFAAFVWRHFGFDAVPGYEYGTHDFDTSSLWLSGSHSVLPVGALWHIDLQGKQTVYAVQYRPYGLTVDGSGHPWFTSLIRGQPSQIVEVLSY